MGRYASRVLVWVLAWISVTGCVLAPSAERRSDPDREGANPSQADAAADRLLARVVRGVVRDDTGSFRSELIFGEVLLNWGGDYSIRRSRARFEISLSRRHQDAMNSLPSRFDVVLVGRKAFMREASSPVRPAGRWVQASKRHLFADLQCWPAGQRALPDRTLMLLLNADAVGFDPERDRSIIVATVPARLASGVFPDPALAAVMSGDHSAQVTVRIGHFRGELTTLELPGKALNAALKRAGAKLNPATARDLQAASYFAWYSDFDLPTLVRPPRGHSVLKPGQKAPLPQPRQMCSTTKI